VIIAATLRKVGDGSAIDLKMENQIPSKVHSPKNNKTLARLSVGGSD
jgi:hypothetical protein